MSKHTPRTVTGIVTQLHEGIDAVHKAEIARLKAQNAELLAALERFYSYEQQRSSPDTAWETNMMTQARTAIAKAKEQSK